jgi:phosphoglycolate phosphatase-like HAD superfamily hydrolase
VAALKFRGSVIEAVIFDLDGTLIHTTVDFRKMKQRLIEELIRRGVSPELVDPRDTIVGNLERAITDLASRGRASEERELRYEVGRLMDLTEMERVSETRPVEGSGDCLDALRGRDLRIGILTRGSRPYALAALHQAGLEQRFDAMVCRDDHPEEEAKPNGKAMERVAAQLHTAPHKCLMVGDHLMDLACAIATSAQFIGVLTGAFSQQDWSKNGDPIIITSVAQLPGRLGIDKQ